MRSRAAPLLRTLRAHGDAVGVAALTVASLLVLWLQPIDPGAGVSRHRDWLAVVFVLLSTLPLLLSRRAPLTVAAIVVCASLVGSVRGYALAISTVGALVALAAGAYLTDRPRTIALGIFTLLALLVVSAVSGGSLLHLQPLVANASAPLLALIAGDVMRTRRLYADRWQARAEEIERLRDADQQRAVAQERVRLARDVHDIVGHYLAGIALQARAGLRKVRTEPARAGDALTQIDQLASDALAETRHAVGVIRSDNALVDLRPAPGVDDIEDLVARLRSSDVRVELRRDMNSRSLPAGLQTAVYRIVQEALNNVIKHAGRANALITIEQHAETLTLSVRDDGATSPSARHDGQGNGVRGMRERALQVGGTLQAGPASEGGWHVQARLPIDPAAVA